MEEEVIEMLYESCDHDMDATIDHIERMHNEAIKFDWGSIMFHQCMILCDGYIRINVKRKQVPNVINQMVIQYLRVPYVKSEKFQLFIKIRHNARTVVLTDDHIELTDTIETIKAVLRDRTGIPIEQQILTTLGGKTLEDGRTLSDYDIHNEQTLICSLRLRGNTGK